MSDGATRLRQQLLTLYARDAAKRQELVDRGELWDGYHPEMEAVHRQNAQALAALLDAAGWPSEAEVGADGAEAAWIVAVHAIGEPAFQRRCRTLLAQAVARGEARPAHLATLVDRIRFNERRPQVYGTILDWDAAGRLSPWTMEDPDGVAARRRQVGLPSLEERVAAARAAAALEGAVPPTSYPERQATLLAWARRVGWCDG